MRVEIVPVEAIPEIAPGDDLGAIVAAAVERDGLREGDVVAVTQKVVSKAEGRVVRSDDGDRGAWVERESHRVVARRGDLVIAETRHGFVCANAGVDASNVEAGSLTLLPEDPDASAEAIRLAIRERLGREVGVVVTDTFGRPWREGLVNVAIGVAGMPAAIDLRGTADHHGRELEATIVALADEVAAASGLVMGKDARVPVAIVRGISTAGAPGTGRDLVRSAADDLFRESPLQAATSRREAEGFEPGADVPVEALREAVIAALATATPHDTVPWSFVALTTRHAIDRLLDAVVERKRADLVADGRDDASVVARLEEPIRVLGSAGAVVVPLVSFASARAHADEGRRRAERERFLLATGAAIERLRAALHAQGLESAWNVSPLFAPDETRAALDVGDAWFPVGAVAVGRTRTGAAPPRPPSDPLPLRLER